MANATRPVTSRTQSPGITSPAHKSAIDPALHAQSNHPQLASSASAGLRASTSPHNAKTSTLRFAPPPLTGAAALRDEQQLRGELPDRQSNLTSPNPAMTAVNELRAGAGVNGAITRVRDSPPRASSSSASGKMVTATPTVAEPMQIDQPTTSPTSVTGSDSISQTTQPSSSQSLKPPAPSSSRSDNKASTYPPQPPQPLGSSAPSRGMSLPGSKTAAKKHKCHHCATEFTRHHNLKSHLLTHSQEKPFSCQQCQARFRRLHDLKRHAKLHTGEKPHLCNKCGRKFARGDALARHSKGPGGCAGRRSSVGDDEYLDGDPDDMDIDDEPEQDPGRRKSEPNHHYRKPSLQITPDNSSSSTRLHSSTFPGVAAMSRGASTSTGDTGPSTHLSPRLNTSSSLGSSHYNAPPSNFAHGGMTESPRPLSPGQTESRRLSATQPMSFSRDRSPSQSHSLPHPQGRNASYGASGINLPPPNSHPPQLPSIGGLTSDHRQPSVTSSTARDGASSGRPPPLVNTQPQQRHGTGSLSSTNPPSASSSHHHNSGSSTRDMFGTGPHVPAAIPPDTALIEQNRRLEAEVRDLKARFAHYEGIMAQLSEENAALRGQQRQQRPEPAHPKAPEPGPPHR